MRRSRVIDWAVLLAYAEVFHDASADQIIRVLKVTTRPVSVTDCERRLIRKYWRRLTARGLTISADEPEQETVTE